MILSFPHRFLLFSGQFPSSTNHQHVILIGVSLRDAGIDPGAYARL